MPLTEINLQTVRDGSEEMDFFFVQMDFSAGGLISH